MKKIVDFIFFRGIVYMLSFLSYNSSLFNLLKIIKICKNKKLVFYIQKYIVEIGIFFLLFLLICLGYKYFKNVIKEAEENLFEIEEFEKEEPNNQIMYIGTYILPMIASFYKLSILWIFVYEIFIYIIYCKNINYHYKILFGFWYSSYSIKVNGDQKKILFTNKDEADLCKMKGTRIQLKSIKIGINRIEKDFFVL